MLTLHSEAQRLAHEQREKLVPVDGKRFYAGQLLLEQSAEICDRLRSAMVLFAMISGETPHRRWRASASQLHLDAAQAGRNAVRVILAMLVTAAFWWWSGSLQGQEIMMQVAVVCSLFATRDNPVKAAQGVVVGSAISAVLAFGSSCHLYCPCCC